MIIDLQKAVVAFLAPLLAADPTLDGVPYQVRTAMEEADRPLPEDRHVVVVLCREAKSPITYLKDCMVEIFVATPIDVEGVTVASGARVESALERCFLRDATPTASALLAAAVVAQVPGWTYAGYYAEGWTEGREDTNHLPVYAVKVGCVRS